MSESELSIKVVGNYRHSQAEPTDCAKCHNAKWGSVLIDGICAECLTSGRYIVDKLIEWNNHKSDANHIECSDFEKLLVKIKDYFDESI